MRTTHTVVAILALCLGVACSRAPDPTAWREPTPCGDDCCDADYLALPGDLGPGPGAVGDAELALRLEALRTHEASRFEGRWTRRRLRRDLVRELHAEPLLASLEGQRAPVALSPAEVVHGVTQHRVRWTDPLVGEIEGLLLLPLDDEVGTRPAIVGLHGHNEDASDFALESGGYALARAGFVVAVPAMRANGEGRCESETALALLRAGWSLMAVRTYEVLRVHQWLAARPDVDADRIGLVGHSGGATVGSVAVRLSDGFEAFVSDFTSEFSMVEEGPSGVRIIDETSPALHPYRMLLADLSTLPIPALRVDYGAAGEPEGQAQIEEFLVEQLVNRVDRSRAPQQDIE